MKDTAKVLKALSNENRLAIFEYLRSHDLSCDGPGGGCSVGDIAQQYDLALSTISHHIKELKEAGLIKCVQRGQFTYCIVNQEKVEELRNFFSSDL
jgi:DNA-binding transcriptional ArsR family regulator